MTECVFFDVCGNANKQCNECSRQLSKKDCLKIVKSFDKLKKERGV